MLTFNDTLAIANTASTGTCVAQQLTNMFMWDAAVTITDTTPVAFTFVYLSGNSVTATAHGALTGLKVALTTSNTLPTGLSPGNYYAIRIDANTLQFATSQALAVAGTAVTLSGAGVGTQTATPAALVGTLVVQKSNTIPTTPTGTQAWSTITLPTTAATQNVSATTLTYFDPACAYHYMRFLLTTTAGQASASVLINGKGQ